MMDSLRSRLVQWDTWRRASTNRGIFAAMLTVGIMTILVKLVSLVKELVVAHQFGTGNALDAFLVAFLLPSFAVNVVAGSFNAALIPTYIQVREQEGQEAAQRLFSGTMVWSALSLTAVSVLLALLAPYLLPVMGSGFGSGKLELTRSLFYIMLPILVISGLGTIWRAVLNSGERFALAAAAPVMTAIVTVVTLLVAGGVWGIYALAVGTVVGGALEAAVLAWSLKRQKFSLLPRWHGVDNALRQVVSQSVPMIAGAFLMSSTLLVDRSMAAMLGSGSVSALNYGTKITILVQGVSSLALGTAVLPHFSRMVAAGDWGGIRHTLKTYSGLILALTVPLTLLLAYFSEPLISSLFQRGAFNAGDVRLVSKIQALFVLQIPAYVLSIMVVRLISSVKANRLLMWGAAISFLLNVALNYLFMQWLGVAGIALSTSIVIVLSFCYLTAALLATLRNREQS